MVEENLEKERRVPTNWWYFGATVIDDRGRPFRFHSGSAGERLAANRLLLQAVKADPSLRPRLRLWDLLPLIITAIVAWSSWSRRGTVSLATLIIFGAIALATALSVTVLPWSPLLTGSRIAIQAARRIRERKCAACGYDLPSDSQNELAICPECGAAWKLNAPTSERVSA